MGRVTEVAPGLRCWSAWHEEWNEDVGSVAVDTADGLVFIDRLRLRPRSGGPHVLLTVYWHGRATGEVGAGRVWAPARSARPLRNRDVPVTDSFRAGDELPGGIQALQTPRVSEVAYWIPQHGALVVGGILLGAGGTSRGATTDVLRLCPERWLGAGTPTTCGRCCGPLLELPLERILASRTASQ